MWDEWGRFKEFLFTPAWYNLSDVGSEEWLERSRGYIDGTRPAPVFRVPSAFGDPLLGLFDDPLMEAFTQDVRRVQKAFDVVMRFGFRGHSKGGRNGVFFQRSQDQRMMRRTEDLLRGSGEVVRYHLEVDPQDMSALKKIKIVWHNPSGERIVGALNEENGRLLFLDFALY
jgi:hypothetical protein